MTDLDTTSSESKAELKQFERLYSEWKGVSTKAASENISGGVIPCFYKKPPAPDNDLQQKFLEEARSLFLQRKTVELLDNEELKRVWTLLDDHHTPPILDGEKFIGWSDFLWAKEKGGDKLASYFTATVFAKLQQKDSYGRVSTGLLFNYIMRKTWLKQSRIGLSLYDMTGQGFLTEKDLELYISELIPTLPQLDVMEASFHSFYICTAVRRFLFFLDPLRHGRIRIVDILASGFLDDLLELRDPIVASDPPSPVSEGAKPKAQPHRLVGDPSNWFSLESARRVYAQYLNLDSDRNGMLSRQELAKYGTGSLTPVFVERLFQVCLMYEGEMDYKGYLDFVLAMENRKDPAALHYFFKILDVRHLGYLDAFALNFFFRAVQKMLDDADQQWVEFEDVKDEIFDMVKPKDPLKIRLPDLIRSKQGDTVVSILIDFNGFLTYENREVLATEDDEEDEDEQEDEQDDEHDDERLVKSD